MCRWRGTYRAKLKERLLGRAHDYLQQGYDITRALERANDDLDVQVKRGGSPIGWLSDFETSVLQQKAQGTVEVVTDQHGHLPSSSEVRLCQSRLGCGDHPHCRIMVQDHRFPDSPTRVDHLNENVHLAKYDGLEAVEIRRQASYTDSLTQQEILARANTVEMLNKGAALPQQQSRERPDDTDEADVISDSNASRPDRHGSETGFLEDISWYSLPPVETYQAEWGQDVQALDTGVKMGWLVESLYRVATEASMTRTLGPSELRVCLGHLSTLLGSGQWSQRVIKKLFKRLKAFARRYSATVHLHIDPKALAETLQREESELRWSDESQETEHTMASAIGDSGANSEWTDERVWSVVDFVKNLADINISLTRYQSGYQQQWTIGEIRSNQFPV